MTRRVTRGWRVVWSVLALGLAAGPARAAAPAPDGDATATAPDGGAAAPAGDVGPEGAEGATAGPAKGEPAGPGGAAPVKSTLRRKGAAEFPVAKLPECKRGTVNLDAKAGTDAASKPREPTAKELELQAERLDYEKAVARYAAASRDYDHEVREVLNRSMKGRTAYLGKKYDKLVEEVELTERQARAEAIRRFEAFVRKYPKDKAHTPDAMFRLGELYFERSAVDYQDALAKYEKDQRLYDRGKIPEEPQPPSRSYGDSARIYRQLIQAFGETYRYADAVHYLLGYMLAESGDDEGAMKAWTRLVERFPKSEYAPEVVLRMGEIHFDYGEFNKAAENYKKALTYANSKYYDKALYKLAWTYFQIYDYDRAIRTFKKLIAYYDAQKDKGGALGSALRDEAVDYLAKSLAEDDWDNDGLEDDNAGVARALSYLSEGKPYELDIIAKYADALYNLHDRKKYKEAIQAYREALRRAPLDVRAASFQQQIIKIYDVMRDVDHATQERERLAQMFAPGSAWANANKDNPRVVEEITAAVEQATRERALWHHQRAQELKTEAKVEGNPELLAQAMEEYRKAAAAYTDYLNKYPRTPAAYELSFYKAETLYYSGDYAAAAPAYLEVVKNPKHKEFREPAAWSAIKSYEKLIAAAVKAGQLSAKADPNEDWQPPESPAPSTSGGGQEGDKGADADKPPPQPRRAAEPMPVLLQKWLATVDLYVNADLKRKGKREVQGELAYSAGEMFYRYGDNDEARRRFALMLSCYPGNEDAANAIANIINSYRDDNDWGNLERWANLAEKLKLGDPEVAQELRNQIKIFKLGAQFQNAEKLYKEKKYLEAAREFERLANENPDAKFADKAYFNAALAYKEVKYFDSAVRIFEKLVTDARYSKSSFAEESLFELAENYKAFFYFHKAIAAYLTHFERYPNNDNRPYMLFQAAQLQEWDGDYAQAAKTYERYASTFSERDDAASALFKAGSLYQKLQREDQAARIWKRFIGRYASRVGMDELIIDAKLRLARQAKKHRKWKDARELWNDIIREYTARAQQPGSKSARAAAESMYELVELDYRRFQKMRLSGSPKKQQATLKKKIDKLGELQNSYGEIFDYKALDWTICSYYRLGDMFREMAQTLYKAPEPRGLSEEELDAYVTMVEDEGLKFENIAIQRFAVTVAKSRELKVTNQCARQALEAINKYQPEKYPLYKEEKLRPVLTPVYTVDTDIPEAR